jgi:hypothetical protein
MNKAVDYRQYADECRVLASSLNTEEGRSQLLKIAAAWDALANERDRRQGVAARVSPLQLAMAALSGSPLVQG